MLYSGTTQFSQHVDSSACSRCCKARAIRQIIDAAGLMRVKLYQVCGLCSREGKLWQLCTQADAQSDYLCTECLNQPDICELRESATDYCPICLANPPMQQPLRVYSLLSILLPVGVHLKPADLNRLAEAGADEIGTIEALIDSGQHMAAVELINSKVLIASPSGTDEVPMSVATKIDLSKDYDVPQLYNTM